MAQATPTRNLYTHLGVAGLATLCGICVNLFPVDLFFGLNLVFGGFCSTAVALLYGPWYGLISATLVFTPTVNTWSQPYGLIIYALQGLWLGAWHRRTRRDPLELDVAYWASLGAVGIYLIYRVASDLPLLDVSVLFLKQTVNSLVTTCAAYWLVDLLPSRLVPQRTEYSLQLHYSQRLTLVFMVPVLVALIVLGRYRYESLWDRLVLESQQQGAETARDVRFNLTHYQIAVRLIAEQAAREGPGDRLQWLLEDVHRLNPGLHNVYVADHTGTTIAAAPTVNLAGESTVGISYADRPYFRSMLQDGQPVISDLFMGRGGVQEPIVVITQPYFDTDGYFAGYALAALRVTDLALSGSQEKPDAVRVLVDGAKTVITATEQYRPLDPFPFPSGPGVAQIGAVTRVLPEGGSTLQRWQHAFIISSEPVPGTSWQVLTIMSTRSLQEAMLLQYFWWLLSALGCIGAASLLLRLVAGTMTRPVADLAGVDMDTPDVQDDPRLIRWLNAPIPEVRRLVSHIRDQAARLAFMAYHDALTGLPNRAMLLKRLPELLAFGSEVRREIALLYLDLDGFKLINDSLGHAVGDMVLTAAARQVQALVPSSSLVARLGGDEFAVLLMPASRTEALLFAEAIAANFDQPITVARTQVAVSTSIGIAFGDQANDPGELLRFADVAMYEAKRFGKRRVAIFDPAMNERVIHRHQLEMDLRKAIESEAFTLYYQPLADLQTGAVVGVEALVRWCHPTRGVLLPSEFIPLAEETGLVLLIDRWVLGRACRELKSWQEQGLASPWMTVAVNLSAQQFRDPELQAYVAAVLVETGLDPGCLELEITESAMMGDAAVARRTLGALKRLGVRIAIDDFGTGYSSLSYLQRFPIDTLKIDRSFVQRLGQDADAEAIVRATVTLGRALRLELVAEGVETAGQLNILRELSVDRGQGYLFSRPLTASALWRQGGTGHQP